MSVTLYVEGGGQGKDLRIACRRGFRKFIERAGLTGNMPSIVACGGRDNTYDRFKTAQATTGSEAMLLVDAEEPVTQSKPKPWEHLKNRDRWDQPPGASDDQCHLMVQAMESWFLADKDALSSFYGQGFRSQTLPANPNIEQVPKQDVLDGLAQATRDTGKGLYKKGSNSFAILEKLDPEKVRNASPYADRFISALSV